MPKKYSSTFLTPTKPASRVFSFPTSVYRKEDWRARFAYQYPSRLALSAASETLASGHIGVRILWQGYEETSVPAAATPDDVLALLGAKYGFPQELVERSVLKVCGEDSYLFGSEHRMIDFEFVRERVLVDAIPCLVVVNSEGVEIEQAEDEVYHSLNLEISDSKLTKSLASASEALSPPIQPVSRHPSLTAMSFNTLGLPLNSTIQSTSLEKNFLIEIKSVGLSEYGQVGSVRSLGLQMGLFHGSKLLCPILNHNFKSSQDENGNIALEKVINNIDIMQNVATWLSFSEFQV